MLIFLAAAVAIIAAHGWFEREFEHARRISGADPAVGVGMAVMVSATSLVRFTSGSSCRACRPTSSLPIAAPTTVRPRRASNISSSARSPRASCFTASRLLYGFTGTTSSTALPRPSRATGRSIGLAVRPGVRARGPRLQDQRRAVPHVDARRLRGRADAGDGFLRLGAQGRRGRCSASASASTPGPGDRRVAPDHDLRRAGLDRARRGRGLSARPISSGCSLIRRSTMSASR